MTLNGTSLGKNKRHTVVKKKTWQDNACRFEITLFMAYVVNQSVPFIHT